MLNVDKVFTSTWLPKDNVKNYVMDVFDNLQPGIAGITDQQRISLRSALFSALDTSSIANYEPTAPFIDFQENNGVVIPDTPTCINIATDVFKAALGEDIDTTTNTHVGRMIEQEAIILKSAIGFTAANIMQSDLTCATGQYLDALGSLFFSDRKSAVATTVLVTLRNPTASAIYARRDSCSLKDGNGIMFVLGANATIPAAAQGVSGSAVVTFVCEKTGMVVPEESSIQWTLPTGVLDPLGFDNVTLGYDVESDNDFRNRLKETRVSSVGFLASVKAALMRIEGVYDCLVLENTQSYNQQISGVTVLPHSILTYVDFDGTEGTAKSIAEAIFENKAVGCGYTTNVTSTYRQVEYVKTVIDPYFRQSYGVTFYSPKHVPVYIEIYVTSNEYSGVDLASDVKNAIVSWANGDVPYVEGVKIGQDIKAYEIGAAVSVRIPEIQIDEVRVGTSAQISSGSVRVNVNSYQIATVAIDNIGVHIDEVNA